MIRRPRTCYTERQRSLIWDHWQKGDSLQQIAQPFDRGVGAPAPHLQVLRIDRAQLAAVAALRHVAEHDAADRLGMDAGADHGDRLRREQHAKAV